VRSTARFLQVSCGDEIFIFQTRTHFSTYFSD
jgi:hypothetical protein